MDTISADSEKASSVKNVPSACFNLEKLFKSEPKRIPIKNSIYCLVIILIMLFSFAATSYGKNYDKEFLSRIVGTYEYVYEYNTQNIIENHYIILEGYNNQLKGWYYGTSDDFDEMREGYEPGFFLAEMSDLIIAQDSIKFKLHVNFEEFYTKPISLQYRNTKQLPKTKYKKWEAYAGNAPFRSRIYNGTIKNNKIKLNMDEEDRIFKKIK
jgi:hypothetical protein